MLTAFQPRSTTRGSSATNANRWPEISRVFSAAAALGGAERSTYLADACIDDPELRAEVDSLLVAHEAAGPIGQTPFAAGAMAANAASAPRLSPGTRLGPYRIESWVGAGGMGEVYRALDTKLGRAVAIKVLPDSVAHQADRRSRFEQEARSLAALNHPHVGAIYGVEESGDVAALVLEFVDGPTLDQRLARGPLSTQEISQIARQLAEALEAAHDSGIVHRDLKPANIKITPDGNVKVLDFGLAKAIGSPGPAAGPGAAAHLESATRTPTGAATQHGLVVGTPGYMSPEQARGETVDKRADIWAFGCVVFELCAGRAPFVGATIAETAAAVIEREPDWEALPASTPPYLARLLRRCLTKDPKLRLRDIGEARVALLQGPDADRAAPMPREWTRRRATIAAVAALLLGLAGLGLGFWLASPRRPSATSPSNVRFLVFPPEGGAFNRHPARTFFALSPDGSQLAYVAAKNETMVWLRAMSDLESRPVPGTEGAVSVFWSPDGRSLAFLNQDALERVDLPSGVPVTLSEIPAAGVMHGTWGTGGTILLGLSGGAAIYSVPAAGGTPREIVVPDRSKGEVRVHWPWFLPDGKRFLYTARLADGEGELRLGRLDGGSWSPVLRGSSNAQWIDPDTVVFVREGVLMGQRFDLDSARPIGEPFAMAEPVDYVFTTSRAMFSVSRNGGVAHHAGGDLGQLAWVDRSGNEIGTVGGLARYDSQSVRLSRDGTMLMTARIRSELGTPDLWRLDLARQTEERLTADRGSELTGLLVDDNHAVVYAADRGGSVPQLFRKDLGTGVEEALLPAGRQQLVMDLFPEERALAYVERSDAGTFDIFRLPLAPGASPEPLLRSRLSKPELRVSPDGRAMAFVVQEGSRWDLHVVPVPVRGAPVLAAANIVSPPRWSADGRWLYYVGANDTVMMAIAVSTAPSLSVGTPGVLFETKRPMLFMDVSRDGRFLMLIPQVRSREQPIAVSTASL